MKIRKFPLLLLSSTFAFGIAGCNSNNEPAPLVEDSVWTTYPTAKIIKEAKRNNEFVNTGSTAKIEMMRDEYESTQVILTSGKKCSFELVKSELVDEKTGKKIPLENIEVYVQKYMKIPTNVHGSSEAVFFFYAGESIPDMLLPMDKAIEYGENIMQANTNQGFSIEIDSNGLDAGTYKGNFTLKYGGNTQLVPFEVTIWDFKLDHKSSFQSCWLIYSMYMLTGEYDASKEMMNTYAEFLSKYKANPYIIQDSPMNNPTDFVNSVKEWWKIRNFNTITIPYDFPLYYKADSDQGDKAASYIVELAKASTEEDYYLGNTIFYPSTYDEADVGGEKYSATPDFFKKGGEYQKTLEKAIDMLTSQGYFNRHSADWNNKVKDTIRKIPNIFTNTTYVNEWVKNYPATFCPQIQLMNSMEYQEIYKNMAQKNDYGNLWTYTCCIPFYPYPSNHIDDDCLSMRSMGWMEKAYGVNGFLFFMANMYGEEDINSFYETPYDNPWRNDHGQNGGAIGDGFIMYPGRYYGSSTPFPSMRLVTYRDGLEDYEMLEILEEKYQNLCEKYDIEEFDFKNIVNDLYVTLFNDAVTELDHNLVFEARRELAKRILDFDNEDELIKFITASNGKQTLDIYTTSASLKVDGKTLSGEHKGNGYRYRYELADSAKTIEIETATRNKYYYENKGFRNITSILTDGTNVSVTEGSTFELHDGYVKTTLKSMRKDTEIETERFSPAITISGQNFKNAKRIFFQYENPNVDIDLSFKIRLSKNGNGSKQIGTHFSSPGFKKLVSIETKNISFELNGYNTFIISFNNLMDDNTSIYPDRSIIIHDVYVEY